MRACHSSGALHLGLIMNESRYAQAKREFVGLPAVDALLAGGVVPWTLACSQRLGRHVIATRDIQPGAVWSPMPNSQTLAWTPARLLRRNLRWICMLASKCMLVSLIAWRDMCIHRPSPGELVLRERAVAALPRDKFAARLCHGCFRELKGVPAHRVTFLADVQQQVASCHQLSRHIP